MPGWGLVNAVVPKEELDAEVARWCADLLTMSPTALKTVKRSFARIVDRTPNSTILDEVNPGFFASGEQAEGASAFLEKRPPDYSKWR